MDDCFEQDPGRMLSAAGGRQVMDLVLGRPQGIMAIVDEEARFPTASDRLSIEIVVYYVVLHNDPNLPIPIGH